MSTIATSRWRTRGLVALVGAGSVLLPWLLLVPWDFSSAASSSQIAVGVSISVLAAAVVAGAVAFANRQAGQALVGAAYVTTLVLFAFRSIAAGDALWVLGLLLVGLLSLGALSPPSPSGGCCGRDRRRPSAPSGRPPAGSSLVG